LLDTIARAAMNASTSVAKLSSNTVRVPGDVIGKPAMRLKSVKPLLPPKPVSLRKNSSIAANVSACVMIDRYTPLTRERNAKKPNTQASTAGTSTTSAAPMRDAACRSSTTAAGSSRGTP
jgi:hypothetical protein